MRIFRRLSPRKLQAISQLAQLDLDRAYRRRYYVEGRVRPDSATCLHFRINPDTGNSHEIRKPAHWLSCPVQNADFSRDSS